MSDSEEEVAFESADEGDEDNKTEDENGEKTREKKTDNTDMESETAAESAEAAIEPDTKPSSQVTDLGAGDSTTEDSERKEQSHTESSAETSKTENLTETSSSVKKTPEIDSPNVEQSEPKKEEKETPATSKSDAEKPSPETPSESVETTPDSSKLTESGDAKTQEAAKESSELKTGETRTRERTPTRQVERQGAKKEGEEDDVKSEEKARVLDKLADAAESRSGGWGWGNWGTSILSTATSSVSTFTSSVGDGFHTIVESAEAALGALSPEELAAKQQEEKDQEGHPEQDEGKEEPEQPKKEKVVTEPKGEEIEGREVETEEGAGDEKEGEEEKTDEKKEDEDGWFSWGTSPAAWGITSRLSNVTKTVQKTSKTLVTGSLDVLETIGKKTYDVIAEGDHGLKETFKKSGQKPILSQVLKEAQEEAKSRAEQDAEYEESRKCHFGAQFDDFQGMVQLEALEMLSNQCEGKLHNLLGSLPADELGSLKQELVTIKQAFEIDELDSDEDEEKDHDFDRLMADYVGQLGLNTTAERLIQVQERGRKWLADCMADQEAGTQKPEKDIHQVAIQRLAEFTARSVDQFLKIGQLTLLEKSLPVSSFKGKAQNLAEITKVLCAETGILSTKFTKCLNTAADDSEDPDSVTPLITNVYLEASNSGTYIQDAFQLLLPVLQQALVETAQTQKLES